VRNEIKIANHAIKPSAKIWQSLGQTGAIKIHLGCGADVRNGWINIDLLLSAPAKFDTTQPNTACISYDLRNGLPAPDGCASYIFSSHFFEHLEYWHGRKLLQDCYRAMRHDGVFRIVLPDYKRFFRAYLEGDRAFFEPLRYGLVEHETATLGDFMTYVVYQFGEHKTIYDVERLVTVLKNVGFRQVYETSFDPSIDVGNDLRQKYSFYVEAIK
jgi:predicted SAM-dependent methyltransferase